MKIAVIHGQAHRGITYTMVHALLQHFAQESTEIREFFLPKDGPDFCLGCNACFLKGEGSCPSAEKVQPIAEAMEWAEVLILGSPNYVMEMSGALKNLMDHLAYRWVTHRPHGSMFRKVGVAVCSSAGAPAFGVTRSIARQLKWMCCPKVYGFPFISNAMTIADIQPKKRRAMERKAANIAKAVEKRARRPRASLRGKLFFYIFRGMQSAPAAAWNPTDRDWWQAQGWAGKSRPWKE